MGVRRAQCLPGRAALLRPPPRRRHSHAQALRALGNRLVGILHGCLASHVAYQERIAWPAADPAAA
jgi:hypothetical protein